MGLANAVDRVIATLLPREVLVRQFQDLATSTYAQSSRFIQDYRVLTESRMGKSYRVLIQATVATETLKAHLQQVGALARSQALPRILILVAEQNLDDVSPRYWWSEQGLEKTTEVSAALASQLASKGFEIIGIRSQPTLQAVQAFSFNPYPTDSEALMIGTRLEADLIIIGEAYASIAPNVMGQELKTYQGTVNVRVLETAANKKIASQAEEYLAINADAQRGGLEALRGAGKRLGELLALKLSTYWQQSQTRGSQLALEVSGTAQLANFVALREAIENLEGVNGYQIEEIAANKTTLVVDYQYDAQTLAERLLLRKFNQFGLNIYEVTDNYLKIDMVPKSE
jgi:hypothetical protein